MEIMEFTTSQAAELFPPRPKDSHKGLFGKAVLIGGSLEFSCAAKLSAMATSALRSGAGLCTLAVPNSIVQGVLPYVLENTVQPMPAADGHLIFREKAYEELISKASSIAIGMGLGMHEDNMQIIRYILKNYEKRLVLDADALNTLAFDVKELKTAKAEVIITPHLMEFSRLTGKAVDEIKENPVEIATSFAKDMGVTVLLKGSTTYITNGTEVCSVSRGTPGMSKGGSGDVLSGIIAGLAAFSCHSPLQIAATGATIAGIAGELATEKFGEYSMLASDEVKEIPAAIKLITSK